MKYEPWNYSRKLGPLTKHHRYPKHLGGKSIPGNISFVPKKLHQAFHLVFGASSAEKIAQELNENWIDPEYVMVAVPKKHIDAVNTVIYGVNDY
jgi:hypothetical protein